MLKIVEPRELVVLNTTPESVSTLPSEIVVVQVTKVLLNSEVVMYDEPKELVVVYTKPESVSTSPSELVVVQVATEVVLLISEVVVKLSPNEFVVT